MISKKTIEEAESFKNQCLFFGILFLPVGFGILFLFFHQHMKEMINEYHKMNEAENGISSSN